MKNAVMKQNLYVSNLKLLSFNKAFRFVSFYIVLSCFVSTAVFLSLKSMFLYIKFFFFLVFIWKKKKPMKAIKIPTRFQLHFCSDILAKVISSLYRFFTLLHVKEINKNRWTKQHHKGNLFNPFDLSVAGTTLNKS